MVCVTFIALSTFLIKRNGIAAVPIAAGSPRLSLASPHHACKRRLGSIIAVRIEDDKTGAGGYCHAVYSTSGNPSTLL